MYALGEKATLENYWADIVFVNARLIAEPSVKHLAVKLEPHLTNYDDMASADREIRRRKILLRAQKATAVVRVEGHADEVYAATLYEVKNKKRDARFKDLCTMSMSSFRKLTLSAQKEEFIQMKMVLKKPQYSDSFRDAQNRVIDQAIAEIDIILAAEKELEEVEMFHEVAVQAWKEAVNNVRYEVYGDLLKENGQDITATTWARTFFMPPKTTKKLSAEERARLDAARAERKQKRLEQEMQETNEQVEKAKAKLERERKKAAIDKGTKKSKKETSEPPPSESPAGASSEAPPVPESLPVPESNATPEPEVTAGQGVPELQ